MDVFVSTANLEPTLNQRLIRSCLHYGNRNLPSEEVFLPLIMDFTHLILE